MGFPSASNAASAYLASYRQAMPFEIPEHVLARDSAIMLGQLPQIKAKLQADLMATGLAEAGALARQKLVNKAQKERDKITYKINELPYKRMTLADRLSALRGGAGGLGGQSQRQQLAVALLNAAGGGISGDPLSSVRGMSGTVLGMAGDVNTTARPLYDTVGNAVKQIEGSASPFSPDVAQPEPPAVSNPYTPVEVPESTPAGFTTSFTAPAATAQPRTAPVAQPTQIPNNSSEAMNSWIRSYAADRGLQLE